MQVFSSKLLKFTLFAAAVAVVGQWAFIKIYDSRFEYRATDRVTMMLERMKPGGDRQAAACLWSRGSMTIPEGDVFRAIDRLDEWARKEGFEKVSEFEVLGTEIEGGQVKQLEEPVIFVDVRINGKQRRLRVVQGEAMTLLN